MRSYVVFFAAFIAMAFAQSDKVRVAEQSINILPNPDPFFYQPSNGGPSLNNPDPGFSRPSNPNGQYEPISIGPTFVNPSQPPYPYKQYDNPNARGGK